MNQHVSNSQASVRDTSKPARRVAIDVARALAIVGMICVNVGPQRADDLLGKIYMLPFGRASLLFMILAGVGLGLLTHSAKNRTRREIRITILWRAALLFFGGLALQLINHGVSVILTVYGLLFLCAIPFTRLRAKTLAMTTTTLTFVAPLVWVTILELRGIDFKGTPIRLDDPLHVLDGVLFTGPYPALIWIVPLLAGLTLSRLNLSDPRLHRALVIGGLACTAGGLIVARLLVDWTGIDPVDGGFGRLLGSFDHSESPLWLVSGIGSGFALIGFLLMIENWLSKHAVPFIALGRLSLTMYVVHLLLIAVFVRPEPHNTVEGIAYSTLISVFCVVSAHTWVMTRGQGPLERLLRVPTYLHRPTAKVS